MLLNTSLPRWGEEGRYPRDPDGNSYKVLAVLYLARVIAASLSSTSLIALLSAFLHPATGKELPQCNKEAWKLLGDINLVYPSQEHFLQMLLSLTFT